MTKNKSTDSKVVNIGSRLEAKANDETLDKVRRAESEIVAPALQAMRDLGLSDKKIGDILTHTALELLRASLRH